MGTREEITVGMHRDIDVIGRVRTSKRIGSSVLHELDYRAGEKLGELRTDATAPTPTVSLAQQFQDAHAVQFNKMESLDSHYASIPHTPKRRNEAEARNSSSSNSNNNNNNNKKLKIPLSPPVNDITRRIRRLRIRNSLTGGNGNSYQSRTPSQAAVKNATLTKQKPMDLPRFLRPTLNSLNKHREATLKSPVLKATTPRDTTPRDTTPRDTRKPAANATTPIPRSQSVFHRLYTQTTISRSCSMGNVSVNETPPAAALGRHVQHDARQSTWQDARRKTRQDAQQVDPGKSFGAGKSFSVSRSKTSGSLSSQLDRPAWR